MKSNLITALLAFVALTIFCANTLFAQTNTSGNQTDLQFLDLMTMHHEDGVKMTEMAINKSANARVKTLAQKMQADQQKDIPEMRAMRERHFAGQPKAESMTVKGRQMTTQMMMEESQADVQKLEAATGAEFDRLFLDTFIKHHRMGIEMAREEAGTGSDREIKKKAGDIIKVQTRETGEMQLLKKQVAAKKNANGKSGK